MKWQLLEKNILFKRFFRLDEYKIRHEKFAGGEVEITREILERGSAVGVLPYDPVRDEVVLIEQFRAAAITGEGSPWLLEVIAGIIEPGESLEAVARREAMEEAGCKLEDLRLIYQYWVTPGAATEQLSFYVARTNTTNLGGIHGVDTEDEDIKVHVMQRNAALTKLANGEIKNAFAIIALQWLALNHQTLRQQWLT